MHERDRLTRMAAEKTNMEVAASREDLRKARTLGISDRIDREREGDSRGDADRSRIQPTTSPQQPLLRDDEVPFRRSSLESVISGETLESLIALASELKKVRRRLITEGFVIDGTRIYKPNENDLEN
jgi:hypothetical protein